MACSSRSRPRSARSASYRRRSSAASSKNLTALSSPSGACARARCVSTSAVQKTQNDLFTDMLGHPKLPLQVLISYLHYAVIYRKSPVGLPIPEALKKVKREPAEMEALNRMLQEVAWDAVIHHPLSGVKAP